MGLKMTRLTHLTNLISIKQVGNTKILDCFMSYQGLDHFVSQYDNPREALVLLQDKFNEALESYLENTLGEEL